MKFAYYSVMTPTLHPEEAVQVAIDLGLDGIEWRVARRDPSVQDEPPSFFRNNLCTFEADEADGVRAERLMADAGLEVPNLGTYIDVGDMDAVVRHMHVARTIGARSIRVGSAPTGDDYLEARERTRVFLAAVEPVARSLGVRAVVETHFGTVCASATQASALVDGCDPEWIGVLYDVGNMVFEGFEDYRSGIRTLGRYLHLVHLKNAILLAKPGGGAERRWAALDEGFADIGAFLAELQACRYDGWLVIEDFSSGRTDRDRLYHDHAWLTRTLRERGR